MSGIKGEPDAVVCATYSTEHVLKEIGTDKERERERERERDTHKGAEGREQVLAVCLSRANLSLISIANSSSSRPKERDSICMC